MSVIKQHLRDKKCFAMINGLFLKLILCKNITVCTIKI